VQPVLEPQPAQHVHGITADLDAGAEPRELSGLFVDRDLVADFADGGGSGEAAHAGADDRDVEFVAHVGRYSTLPAWRAVQLRSLERNFDGRSTFNRLIHNAVAFGQLQQLVEFFLRRVSADVESQANLRKANRGIFGDT